MWSSNSLKLSSKRAETRSVKWRENCNRRPVPRARTTCKIILLAATSRLLAQSPPPSADRAWHAPEERQLIGDAQRFNSPSLRVAPDKTYSLAELIDLAEANNPE